MISIPWDSDWIEVDSAFGGLALYRASCLRGCFYSSEGREVCEHVVLHRKIKDNGGKIFINPGLTNTSLNFYNANSMVYMTGREHLMAAMRLLKGKILKASSSSN